MRSVDVLCGAYCNVVLVHFDVTSQAGACEGYILPAGLYRSTFMLLVLSKFGSNILS
jgi:hypothetical protein